jgi:hypothetical protein
MSKVIDLADYPNELREYVSRLHSACYNSSREEVCPTYPCELDQLTQKAIEQYSRGLALLEGIADQEHQQCKVLHQLYNNDARENDLTTMMIDNQFYLVPAYITQLLAARSLQPVFKLENSLW